MTKPNAELAYRILDQIDAHPEAWSQSSWVTPSDCGTAYCFAGWALALTGHDLTVVPDGRMQLDGQFVVGDDVTDAALDELGVWEFDIRLFDGYNSREDLGEIVGELFGPRPDAAS